MKVIDLLGEARPSELRVINVLLDGGSRPYKAIKELSGLSDPAVTQALTSLKRRGVVEVEDRAGSRSRPRRFYRLKPEYTRELRDVLETWFGTPYIPVEALVEARKYVRRAAEVAPRVVVKRGKKLVLTREYLGPRESLAFFAFFLLIHRFFACIRDAYHTLDIEGYAERLKEDFIELMGEVVEAWDPCWDGVKRAWFEETIEEEMKRARGLLFAYAFLLRRMRTPRPEEAKLMKRFFARPKPVKTTRKTAVENEGGEKDGDKPTSLRMVADFLRRKTKRGKEVRENGGRGDS